MAQRKILIVTNRVPFPFKDGGNLAMQAMIEGYHAEGWQVYLLSMNTSRHYVPASQLATLYKHLYKFECVDVDNTLRAWPVLKNYFFSKEVEHVKRYDNADFREKLESVCHTFQPDVVQIESVFLTPYLQIVKKNIDAFTVLRMHNVEYQIWQGLSKDFNNKFKQMYLRNLSRRIRKFERDAWKEYDLLIPITQKDASYVNGNEMLNQMIVAPFSIDIEKLKPVALEEKWVAYHIGAMDWIPNVEGIHWFLNKAWPAIRKALPHFEFYFAGRGMPYDFKTLKIPGVHCMGEVQSADDFIEDKKILIVPIWSGGGIRVKILEAMAASKVIITTPAGIKGIDAEPDVHYLQVQKVADFVKAIKWCLENKEAAQEMAERACQLVKSKYDHRLVIKGVIGKLEKNLQQDKPVILN